ncbi:MAG: hypothetical protein GJ680_15000 [Alteromonadaceae bacterium]|nr:hypothetical protein [Alteromonadaceae bacterium]
MPCSSYTDVHYALIFCRVFHVYAIVLRLYGKLVCCNPSNIMHYRHFFINNALAIMISGSLSWFVIVMFSFPQIPFHELDLLDTLGETSNVFMVGLFCVFIAGSKIPENTKIFLVLGMTCMFIGGTADVADEFFVAKNWAALVENAFKTFAALLTLMGLLRLAREAKLSAQRAEHFKKESYTLSLLTGIARELTKTLNLNEALQIIYQKLYDSVPFNQFQVSLFNDNKLESVFVMDELENSVLHKDVDLALAPLRKWVCKYETSLYLFDTSRLADQYFESSSQKQQFLAIRDEHPEYLSGTLFVVPLTIDQRTLGGFTIHLRKTSGLDSHQCHIVESIASYSAIAIGNAISHKQVENKSRELATAYEHLQITQKELVEAEKIAALGRLTASVSHEINTPLGNAITAESALREHLCEIRAKFAQKNLTQTQFSRFLDKCQQTLGHVDSSLRRVNKLITRFRQMSLVQNDETRQYVNLVQILREDEATLRMDPRSKDIDIEFSLPESLYVSSFPGVIHEIIEHLYENSVTHAFEHQLHPKLSVRCEKLSEKSACICFSDNGTGIAMEVQDKIFEPFFSTNMARTAGLGLNIVYNLVHRVLGGKISLQSELSQGTSFHITIPCEEFIPETPQDTRLQRVNKRI